MIVMGWIFWLISFSASRSSSPARTTTDVVPSPTSASCVLEMSAQGERESALLADCFQILAADTGLHQCV